MNKLFLLILVFVSNQTIAFAAALPPTPFPVFLKSGYSTILEFDEQPSRVVLGDTQSFQVERLEKSLVVKTLTNYASSNMFVYFKDQDTRLFVLTASEDAEPTYFKRFEVEKILVKQDYAPSSAKGSTSNRQTTRIVSAQFDNKKDYLTIEVMLAADSKALVKPNWPLVRLVNKGTAIAPFKLWAERRDVQKDSAVKARFIFAKPNLPRDLDGVSLVIPVQGENRSIIRTLKGFKL